ncbi:MAG: Cytochrome-c peroxidase [Verrucomicrobiales bacterium]|nr:Cytochrome-c peroxidase [Verrucomicrobiales bacterium]
MKTNHISTLVIVLSMASATSMMGGEFPVQSLVQIQAKAQGAGVTVNDPGDRAWVIQTSSNLTAWSDAGVVKVHKGSYGSLFSNNVSMPGLYFRALYDPTRQEVASTVQNALLLPSTAFNYSTPVLPPNFLVQPILGQDNTPTTNMTTDAGAALGRVLFYDKRLSTNQTIACASCHRQENGFSDPRRFSTGFAGGSTSRNSMGLSNARWYQRRHFFWDERANTLEDQVLAPIQNPVEMGMTLPALTTRLAAEPFYTDLFTRTFGTPDITSGRISRALAQFVRSIVSTRSKYDAGVSNRFANFTAQERLGRQIFLGQVGNATCAACHGTDNFVPGAAINNNGLEFPYVDLGLGGITGRPQDNGLFKVPSLRNIELTAPYMHDGRFATLEQVVEFYNSGVVDNPNLSPPLRNPPGQPPGPRRLNLTVEQKAALVAFLKTLTDTNLATDPQLSDPFNYGK